MVTDAVAYTGSFFGGYVGPIHLGMVNCFGGERSILDCKSTRNLFDFNSSNAGVYCYSTTCKKLDMTTSLKLNIILPC